MKKKALHITFVSSLIFVAIFLRLYNLNILPLEMHIDEAGLSFSTLPGKIKKLVYMFTSDGKYGSSDTYWTMYKISPLFIILGGILSIVNAVKEIAQRKITINICMLFISFAEIVMFILCGLLTYHINGIFVALVYLLIMH